MAFTEPDHRVAIIGAGLSGIGMGIALRRAGIDDFVIYERAGDIGGTWRDNVYPGIAVDVPAQAYQFSYELNPDWSRVFARGAEVKGYVDHCAERYGIRPHVRLDSDVTAREWDEDAHVWRLTVGGEEVTARFVVSAVGPFIEPKAPRSRASRSSRARCCARRPGRRSSISPASGSVSSGPGQRGADRAAARAEAARLDVYQRTPIWVGPKLDPTDARRREGGLPPGAAAQRVVHRGGDPDPSRSGS